MTKMKSKKMTKSTFAIIIMAIAMVAMLAFGGTYAFFTATATKDSKELTTGTVMLAANSIATITTDFVVPGQSLITDAVKVTSNSNVKTIVFVEFSVAFEGDPTGANNVTDAEATLNEGQYRLNPTMNTTTWTKLRDDSNIYYAIVDVTKSEGVVTPAGALTVCSALTFDAKSTSNDSTPGTLMGKKITITIDSSAIQYAGFENTVDDGASYTKYATRALALEAAYAQATISEPAAG